jgi:Protein of unknown function (DUF3307)
MITADQLVCHAVGDYILQSDWMANTKTKQSVAAFAHVLTYMLPFLFLRPSPFALFVIVSTHFVIDRWRLARYVCWAKNWLAIPQRRESCGVVIGMEYTTCGQHYGKNAVNGTGLCERHGGTEVAPVSPVNYPWSECSATGYHKDRPAWMAVWLMIIADNTMHIFINGLALTYL